MKKILLCALACVLVLAALALSAEKSVIRLGLLSKLNTTEEEFGEVWRKNFAPPSGELEVIIRFYDSMVAMQMGVNRREIHEMVLPEAAAEYALSINPDLEATLVLRSKGMGLAFGFRDDEEGRTLRDRVNSTLEAMRNNWTLPILEGRYLSSHADPQPVKFATTDGAQTVRVAVTGDLPPLDYIAPDGTPAGFNTAMLAEIGSMLGVNVELVEVDAGARTAALTSGRADVVFWYEVSANSDIQPDVPEGVILSQPYYEWDKFIHVRRKAPEASAWWDFFGRNNILNMYWR